MKTNNQQQNGMMYAELKSLRAEVARLKGVSSVPTTTEAPKAQVSYSIDPKTVKALRATFLELLVATENFFGPDKTENTPKPSPELIRTMSEARALLKKG
jgi:hypothetical protein